MWTAASTIRSISFTPTLLAPACCWNVRAGTAFSDLCKSQQTRYMDHSVLRADSPSNRHSIPVRHIQPAKLAPTFLRSRRRSAPALLAEYGELGSSADCSVNLPSAPSDPYTSSVEICINR